jgi:hypothetical protein
MRAPTRSLSVALVALLLSACSMTLPVQGQLQARNETFKGTATGYMNRSGVLTVTSSAGATCSGSFVYVTSRQGEGVFTCDDGRSGPFTFSSTGMSGVGSGTLNGDRFIFTFGG